MKNKIISDVLEILKKEKKINIDKIRADALRLYFNLNPDLKTSGAVSLYHKGKISLSRAAELAGVSVPEFKEILASKGIMRITRAKNTKDMDRKIKKILV